MSASSKEFIAVWKHLKRADFVVFLIGLIVGFIAVHIAYFPAAGRIGELEGQVTGFADQITSLQNDLDERNAQVEDLLSEVENKSAQIVNLQSEIADKEAEISSLEAQLDENITTIASLESQVTSLKQQVATKDNEISNLRQELENLEAAILRLKERPEVLGAYFSPNGLCEERILYWIGRANRTIHILIYSFSLDSIGNALVDAHRRGIEVKVVFEESWTGGVFEDDKLRAAGIAVRTDTNSRSMNNKVMIVDGVVVVTGSYDWSETAQIFNNENLIVIKSASIGSMYEGEFSRIWGQSKA